MELYIDDGRCEKCNTTEYAYVVHMLASADGKEHTVCDDCAPLVVKCGYTDY